MANNYRDIDKEELMQYANEYVEECVSKIKHHATGSGKVVEIPDRNLPTYKFFILYWLKNRHIDIYSRQHIYKVMKDETHPLCDTLKNIREYFDAVAEDIVANEGKGIFYAKNRLGMRDTPKDDDKPQEKIQIEIINGKGDIKDD